MAGVLLGCVSDSRRFRNRDGGCPGRSPKHSSTRRVASYSRGLCRNRSTQASWHPFSRESAVLFDVERSNRGTKRRKEAHVCIMFAYVTMPLRGNAADYVDIIRLTEQGQPQHTTGRRNTIPRHTKHSESLPFGLAITITCLTPYSYNTFCYMQSAVIYLRKKINTPPQRAVYKECGSLYATRMPVWFGCRNEDVS